MKMLSAVAPGLFWACLSQDATVEPVGDVSGPPPHLDANAAASDSASRASDSGLFALLIDVAVSPGGLSPSFQDDVDAYFVALPHLASEVQLHIVRATQDTFVTVDGQAMPAGEATVSVAVPIGESSIAVEASRDGRLRTVTVAVDRASRADLAQQQFLKAPNAAGGDLFGNALAAGEGGLVVAAVLDDAERASATSAGAAHIFLEEDELWIHDATVAALSPDSDDAFGTSLAFGEDLVVVGAPGDDGVDNTLENSGAAFVFDRDAGGVWRLAAILRAPTPTAHAHFGASVAIAQDVLAIGAPLQTHSTATVPEAGAVHLWRSLDAGDWLHDGVLEQAHPDGIDGLGDRFGSTLAAAGETLLVGAPGEDGSSTTGLLNDTPGAGAAYVFELDGSRSPQLAATLKASDPQQGAFFGGSVSIHATTAAVGAPVAATNGVLSGVVHVFDAAQAWQETARLSLEDADDGDRFGASVSVRGTVLAVGADGDDSTLVGIDPQGTNNLGENNGAAYLFSLSHETGWTLSSTIKPLTTDDFDDFGDKVLLSPTSLFVGAEDEDSASTDPADNGVTNAGALYVFY